jgi:hypothetical protein
MEILVVKIKISFLDLPKLSNKNINTRIELWCI